jgi:putative membrane protein
MPAGHRAGAGKRSVEQENEEMNGNWNAWYFGWCWVLWFGVIFLFISSFGNWGYTYRAHRKVDEVVREKDALDVLNERYAKGEVGREDYLRMKSDISESRAGPRKVA